MTITTADAVPPADAAQRRAARVVGFLYLLLMTTGIFAQIIVPGSLPGDGAEPGRLADTAGQIVADARLFRLGAAVDLLTNAGDVALAVAYFVLLRPVSPALAALGASWRVAQAAIIGGYSLTNIVVLQVLSGTAQTQALTQAQAAALAWVATSAHTIGYSFGIVLMGLGSAVFSLLLFRSRYVPRPLAALGVFASGLMTAGSLVLIVFPEAALVVNPGLYVPMFCFEVATGLWLLIRGVR